MATTTPRAPTPPPRSEPITTTLLESTPQTSSSTLTSTSANILPTISENSVLLRPPQTGTSPLTRPLQTLPSIELSPILSKSSALYSPRRSPAPLTGAAAMADAKRKRPADRGSRETTPNPAVSAMQALMGGGGGMSKATDAPAPTKLSEPLRQVAEKISIPTEQINSATSTAQTSPVSLSSFDNVSQTNGNGTALTATSTDSNDITSRFVAEPSEMTDRPPNESNAPASSAPDEEDSAKAFSYPGLPTQQEERPAGPTRGMSLPGTEQQGSAKQSPATNKRHKCPYCSTDFTRHHNLKSHLLTHSQEKPYVCSTCSARFRRLHDLKRHTKLHTGERPHTCDQCGRRFARGDALARHTKGAGGCAGRRSSFGADEEILDGMTDTMDGVEYTNEDDDSSTADLNRRVSEPSRKRVQVETPHDSGRTIYRHHSSTYPPIQHRPGDMGPPSVVHPGSSNATSPRDGTGPGAGSLNTSYFQNYNQSGLIESPKPISPGQPGDARRLSVDPGSAGPFGRNRSPSLTTQFQQTHFGRGNGGRTPPAQFPGASHMSQAGSNQLPPLTLSTSIAPRANMTGHGPSMLQHQQIPHNAMSNPTSASSHGQSSGSSMRELLGTNPGGNDGELWAHLRQLEGKFVRMQDEYELRISRLQEEVISLRAQLNGSQTTGPAGSYPGEPRY